MKNILNKDSDFEGRHVLLREIQYEDTELIVDWRNDSEQGKFLQTEPLTKKVHIEFLHHYFKRDNDFYFIAETKKSRKPVGTIAIYNVDIRCKRAVFGRLYILEKYKIYALEMSYLALRFAFEILQLHKVCADVQQKNMKALRFDSMLGFHKEAVLKEHMWNGEMFDDVVLFAMFKQDYGQFVNRYGSFLKERKT